MPKALGQSAAVKQLNQDRPLDFESYEQDTEAYGLGKDGKYGYGKYKIGKSVESLEPMAVRMHPSPSKVLSKGGGGGEGEGVGEGKRRET